MSSFTQHLTIEAVPRPVTGWLGAILPPSCQRPRWKTHGFTYAVGSLDRPEELIEVPDHFIFDGASVPWAFRILVPMAHPNYIQATALHDYMLHAGRHSRARCDAVFHEALGVLGMPRTWRFILYAAVRIGAIRWHIRTALGGPRNAI